MNHKDVILIAVIFFIGIILRLYSLGTTLPVFVDEAIYVRWAQVMKAEETLRFLPLSDGKQPLFMWLVIPSLKLFSDPLFAGRFISVLSGLGIMIEMGLVSWLLFRSKQVAIITFFLIASSPFLVFFDRKALVDSLLTFWGMGALVLGLLFVRNPRFDLSLLIGGALGGAWLTKTPGEFFFFLLPTVLLVAPKKSLADWKFLLKALSGFLVALIVGFGIYNILRLGPNFHLIGSRNLDYIYSLNEIISHPLTPLISNLEQVGWWLIILMTLPIVILGVIGAYRMLRRMPSKALLLFVWTIGPILIESIFGKVFTARYILFTVPAMLLFGAYGISRVSPTIWKSGLPGTACGRSPLT
ncbi:MAG: hypothetical protein UW69_C0001G0043 [Microgenomates group bacterium GW2011_GWA2_44_7]|nr:MAG: hypothetical protein UW69_C0001G0043 [Microgenomates group bacterium GW2011_GWA2_44_7]